MFDYPLQRCAANQPILPDAIRQLVDVSPPLVQLRLADLATSLERRTTLRPDAVTGPAIRVALERLLPQMVDRQLFASRHAEALRHLGVIHAT